MNPIRLLPCAIALAVLPAAFGAGAIEVRVDATRTGAPISPYIYGQFIEHLGRCI